MPARGKQPVRSLILLRKRLRQRSVGFRAAGTRTQACLLLTGFQAAQYKERAFSQRLADSDALQSNINSLANIRRTGAKKSSGVSERYLQQLGRPCRAELPKLWRSNGEAADVSDGVLSIHSNHSVASKFYCSRVCETPTGMSVEQDSVWVDQLGA